MKVLDTTPINNESDESVETAVATPQVLGLIARIVISGGQKFIKVLRNGATVRTFKAVIHKGKQGKHILGHNNFTVGKSYLTKNADDLLNRYAGKGKMINENKERFSHTQYIGDYFDRSTNHYIPTKNGIIHYSKDGAHIVPSRP